MIIFSLHLMLLLRGFNKCWTWILTNPSDPAMLVVQTFGCVCPCQVAGLRREAVRAVRKQALASWSGTFFFCIVFTAFELTLHLLFYQPFLFYKKRRPYVVLTCGLIESVQELASPAFSRFIIVSCICSNIAVLLPKFISHAFPLT